MDLIDQLLAAMYSNWLVLAAVIAILLLIIIILNWCDCSSEKEKAKAEGMRRMFDEMSKQKADVSYKLPGDIRRIIGTVK